MLLPKHLDEIDELARLLEAREKVVLFQPLVIVLNERADDLGGTDQDAWLKVSLVVQTPPPDSS